MEDCGLLQIAWGFLCLQLQLSVAAPDCIGGKEHSVDFYVVYIHRLFITWRTKRALFALYISSLSLIFC